MSGSPTSVSCAPYTTVVRGSSLSFTANVSSMTAYNLQWTITRTGGSGVTFTNGGATTLSVQNIAGNNTQQVDISPTATATSFTVSVQGQSSCTATVGTATTSSSISIIDALATINNNFEIYTHRSAGTGGFDTLKNMVLNASSGSWSLPGGLTTVTPTYTPSGSSPVITVPVHSPEGQTITITNPGSLNTAIIKEDNNVTDANSLDQYNTIATWTENYPSTTKWSTNLVNINVTFRNCGGNIFHSGYFAKVSPANNSQFNGTYTYPIVKYSAKCWTGMNLGATTMQSSATDSRASSGGWYFLQNQSRGYYHDGTTMTPSYWPSWPPTYTPDNLWPINKDPCTILLGNGWRLPSISYFTWQGYIPAYATTLKLHANGSLKYDMSLYQRGVWAVYRYLETISGVDHWWEGYSNILGGQLISTTGYIGAGVRCVHK